MKPKTKLQKRVAELMSFAMGMTKNQYDFAKNEVFQPVGYRKKNGVTCMECGNFFDDKSDETKMICPSCGTEIVVKASMKRTYNDSCFISIVTTLREFQLIKYFRVSKDCKAGRVSYFECYEVCQNWIMGDGQIAVVARPRLMNSAYISNPFSHGEMAIRNYCPDVHDVHSMKMIYEDSLPEFRKIGFDRAIDDIYPVALIKRLLNWTRAETLIKANQLSLLRLYVNGFSNRTEQYWNSIKICMRNNYIVDDATLYVDYLDLMQRYGKDLRNAYYVCPSNLHEAHNIYMQRKMRDDEKLRKKRETERMMKQKEQEKAFLERIAKFADLTITDGKIVISPLKSLEEFMQEGEAMHHCVFSNEYWKRNDCLILSAKIENQRVETIEINLNKFNIVQSRAKCNGVSGHHDTIVGLVKNNINKIRSLATA